MKAETFLHNRSQLSNQYNKCDSAATYNLDFSTSYQIILLTRSFCCCLTSIFHMFPRKILSP